MKEVHTINYYPINEGAARRAKEMNSFSDYKEGSATAEYRAMVDKAAAIAEQQKSRVDPMYHEKIDHLLDTYARKLAENMNQGFAIDARVPSVMIAGPANFPVGKKEKQNRARDSNMEEWRYIQGLLEMLNLFRKNPRQVLTRGQLLEKLWDIDERFVDEHTLTTSISRIRSKIESDGGAPYIKTVYGMGYQWTGGEAK